MSRKKIIIIVFLAFFCLLFNYQGSIAYAMTSEEMNALIAKLQAQIVSLQQQLGQTSTAAQTVWCHNFNSNISVGNIGAEVEALHAILEKEGFVISQDEKLNKEYDESTASAVTGFQEKHRNDVLNSLGLKYGTGFVGKGTRAKLNQLYGCKTTTLAPIQTPVTSVVLPAIPESVTSQTTAQKQEQTISSTVTGAGTGFHRFEILDSSGCSPCLVGTVCKPCPPKSEYTIYKAKVAVYDAKGNYIGTKDTSSGMAVFENLPYGSYTAIPWGNYTAVISAVGYETDKLSFTVCATCGTDSAVNLKKSSTTATASSITILSPNGGESWTLGSLQKISWTSSGMPLDHKIIVIRLRSLAGVEYNLLENTPNDGLAQITVPAALASGSYLLEIKTSVDGTTVFDQSDALFSIGTAKTPTVYEQVKCVFKNATTKQECYSVTASNGASYTCAGTDGCVVDVKGPQGQNLTWKSSCGGYAYTVIDGTNEYTEFICPLVTTQPSSIIVVSPNGGEKWEIGKTYDIVWKTAGLNEAIVWLNKYTGDITNGCRLTSGSVSGGKHSWTIGKDLCSITAGDKFKILVQEADETHQPRIEDVSDNFFSIVSADSTIPTQTSSTIPAPAIPVSVPAIYVLAPKGGEQFRVGDDIVIQWKNFGMAGVTGLQQNVQLVRSSDKTTILDLGSTAGSGDLANIKWHVNADPGNYYIRVYNAASSGVGGEGTSASFSVISSSAGLKDIENQLASISSAISKLLEEWKK